MNKHIEVVKKWLADKDSVSRAELIANAAEAAEAAEAADEAAAGAWDTDALAIDAAAEAAGAASAQFNPAADEAYATYWVRKYKELTGE